MCNCLWSNFAPFKYIVHSYFRESVKIMWLFLSSLCALLCIALCLYDHQITYYEYNITSTWLEHGAYTSKRYNTSILVQIRQYSYMGTCLMWIWASAYTYKRTRMINWSLNHILYKYEYNQYIIGASSVCTRTYGFVIDSLQRTAKLVFCNRYLRGKETDIDEWWLWFWWMIKWNAG